MGGGIKNEENIVVGKVLPKLINPAGIAKKL